VHKKRIILIFFLLFKTSQALFFSFYLHDKENQLLSMLPDASIGADDEGYFSSVDNFFEKGEYFYLGQHSNFQKTIAPRVPGLSLTYMIFRAFLNKNSAINFLVIFQTLLFSTALFYFFVTVFSIKKTWLFFLIFLGDTYLSYYNNIPYLAESISISLIIFSIVFIYKYFNGYNNKFLLLSGLFAGLSFFYKVANIAFLFSLSVFIIYILLTLKWKAIKILKTALIFFIPFLVLEALWVSRNYYKTNELIFTQQLKGQNAIDIMENQNDIFYSVVNFCKSFGGDYIRWNPNSAMAWFSTEEYLQHMNFKRPGLEVFPKHIQDDKNKIEELKQARQAWWSSQEKLATKMQRENATKEAIYIFNTLKQDIYTNHTFLFHISSRFIYSFNLLYESSTYYFPYTFAEANIFEKFIKIVARAIYYLVMIIPLIFFPFYILKYKKLNKPLIDFSYLTSFGFIFLYCFLFRTSEFRYNHTIYLFFMIITVFFFLLLLSPLTKSEKLDNRII
jgi:hypothetical protein